MREKGFTLSCSSRQLQRKELEAAACTLKPPYLQQFPDKKQCQGHWIGLSVSVKPVNIILAGVPRSVLPIKVAVHWERL